MKLVVGALGHPVDMAADSSVVVPLDTNEANRVVPWCH